MVEYLMILSVGVHVHVNRQCDELLLHTLHKVRYIRFLCWHVYCVSFFNWTEKKKKKKSTHEFKHYSMVFVALFHTSSIRLMFVSTFMVHCSQMCAKVDPKVNERTMNFVLLYVPPMYCETQNCVCVEIDRVSSRFWCHCLVIFGLAPKEKRKTKTLT